MAGIDPRFYYLTLGLLTLCTVVGLIVAYRLQREVNEDLAPPTEKELFNPLEKAFYSGLMDEAEFNRIQESMARQKGESSPAGSKTAKLPKKSAEAKPIVPPSDLEDPEEPETEADDD